MQTKQELRIWAKEKRKTRDKSIDKILVTKLKNTKEYKSATNILLYYPLPHEIDLSALLEDEEKQFYLPKIENDNLLCCPYKSGDELCISCFKTSEPLSLPVKKTEIELAIIPALCADKNNYRLGYGGGFYDRFLKDFEGVKITCLPQNLIVKTVFPEHSDIPVDFIITD